MAELFLAKDTKREKLVVIKRILPYLSSEVEFVRMFLDEARIAAQLHHNNIIQVHELGQLDESIFISMEFVEGVDLRKILQEEMKAVSRVPYRMAALVIAQVCAGLYYAHNSIGLDGARMEIVHRDVSPQNVMVGFDGSVKLVDFGIAKAGALVERSKPGVIKGKFLYLAPEQLTTDRLDHRADLFALGTMLYEVTTAKSPFFKTTTEAVIYAIRSEDPPPPHLVIPDYPIALSQIVMKCLTKDRDRRYQQANEIQRDLEKFLHKQPATTEDLVQYVASLMGTEEERTALFIPSEARSAPKLADAREELTRPLTPSAQSMKSGTGPVGRRPTGEGPLITASPPAPEYDPAKDERTQTARPEDLSGAMNQGLKPTVSPPIRRQSSQKYAPVGEDKQAATTASLPGAIEATRRTSNPSLPRLPPTLPPTQPRTEPAREPPVLPRTLALEDSGVSEASGPVFDRVPSRSGRPVPRTRPSRPQLRPPPVAEGSFDDERSTGDFQSRFSNSGASDPRGRLSKSPLLLGAGAFVAVVVLALVAVKVWREQSASADPLPDEVVDAGPPTVKIMPPPGDPLAVADAGEAAPDAGELAAAPIEDAGVALPVRPSADRVTVIIKAPSGTRINKGKFSAGGSYELPPGRLRLVYRCPPKKRRRAQEWDRSYKIVAQRNGKPLVISLCRK